MRLTRRSCRKFGLTLLFILCSRGALAREFGLAIRADSIEDLYDLASEEELSADELTLLVALFQEPLELNSADRFALFDLPGLTWAEVDAIIKARDDAGGFSAKTDLLAVPGISAAIYRGLAPFVRVEPPNDANERPLVRGRARLGTAFEAGLGADLRAVVTPEALPSGYLQAEAKGLRRFSAGVLLLERPMVSPAWEQNAGYLVDDSGACDASAKYSCAQPRLGLKALYATATWAPWRVVVGTYNVGFAERLTFDSTQSRFPRTWDERPSFAFDRQEGTLRPTASLRGAAVSLTPVALPVGELSATAFFSLQEHDLYSSDLWYEGDDYQSQAACEKDSDCADGYTCKENHRCASSRVYDRAVPGRKFLYHTFQTAFAEVLGGAHAMWQFDDRTHIGLTAYRATTYFNIPSEARPRFAPSARYPKRPDFGAIGIDGALGGGLASGSYLATAEFSLTHRGHPAATAALMLSPTDWVEWQASLFWYSRDYENPHSRGEAAQAETLGLRQRNLEGLRLAMQLRPWSVLTLSTDAVLYFKRFRPAWADGRLAWSEDPWSDLRVGERARLELSPSEELVFQVDYANHDLQENGRADLCTTRQDSAGAPATTCGSYAPTDSTSDEPGRGEKWRLELAATTTRVPGVRLAVKYVLAALDVPDLDDRFDVEHYLHAALSATLWPGGRLWGAVKYWPWQSETNGDNALAAYAGVSQRCCDGLFAASLVWGVTGNWRAAAADFDVRHFGSLELQSEF